MQFYLRGTQFEVLRRSWFLWFIYYSFVISVQTPKQNHRNFTSARPQVCSFIVSIIYLLPVRSIQTNCNRS